MDLDTRGRSRGRDYCLTRVLTHRLCVQIPLTVCGNNPGQKAWPKASKPGMYNQIWFGMQ